MLRLTVVLLLGVLAQQTFADEPEAIVGGSAAAPGQFPYQCAMNLNGNHLCGCSILSSTKILTAAHCVHDIVSAPYSNLRILVGSTDSNGGSAYAVQRVVMHESYQPFQESSWVNDVAVITLRSAIQFNSYQAPVRLASSPPRAGMQCVLSGWGMTRAKGPTSRNLLKMNCALVDNSSCMMSHGMNIYSNQICAFARQGVGACQGDSGGPLVCNGEQHGITSWVAPCALGYPDVYTSVYYHLNFIKREMAN